MVTLYDFEAGLWGVSMSYGFGRINLNQDRKFVKSGRRSLKLEPCFASGSRSVMRLSFTSSKLGFDYPGLHNKSCLLADIYSVDSAQIEFGLYFSNDFRKGSSPTVVALRPGWNRVEFDIPLEKLQFHYSLEDARGMTIGFSQGGQGIPPVVYLDNVGFATRTTQLKPIQITLKNTDAVKEIADFEDPIQEHAFMYSNGGGLIPLLQVVEASQFGVKAPSGSKMLRIVIYPKKSEGMTWTQINLAEGLLKAVNLKQYLDKLDQYELKLNIYQKSDHSLLLELNPYYSGDKQNWAGIKTKKGEWVEFKKPLAHFKDYIESPQRFAFAWIDYIGPEELCEYYIDNIRLEKISAKP